MWVLGIKFMSWGLAELSLTTDTSHQPDFTVLLELWQNTNDTVYNRAHNPLSATVYLKCSFCNWKTEFKIYLVLMTVNFETYTWLGYSKIGPIWVHIYISSSKFCVLKCQSAIASEM